VKIGRTTAVRSRTVCRFQTGVARQGGLSFLALHRQGQNSTQGRWIGNLRIKHFKILLSHHHIYHRGRKGRCQPSTNLEHALHEDLSHPHECCFGRDDGKHQRILGRRHQMFDMKQYRIPPRSTCTRTGTVSGNYLPCFDPLPHPAYGTLDKHYLPQTFRLCII